MNEYYRYKVVARKHSIINDIVKYYEILYLVLSWITISAIKCLLIQMIKLKSEKVKEDIKILLHQILLIVIRQHHKESGTNFRNNVVEVVVENLHINR